MTLYILKSLEKYDVAVIGGGLLGTSISYWLSNLFDLKIVLIEKELEVGEHASSRNTGVVHSPFYLNPEKKTKIARAAFLSHEMWRRFAEKKSLPWKSVGTIEVAENQVQHKILERYLKWGPKNGMDEKDLELLDGKEVTDREPNISCHSALHCKTDVVVDYGMFTRQLREESEKNGTKFLVKHKLESIENMQDRVLLKLQNNEKLISRFVINCAGGYSLDIAKKFGIATNYSSLHFRGEYWIAQKEYANLVRTNVYSVPSFPDFPFLDPHWILRVDGRSEVGPNAVPVPTPETYSGYIGDFDTFILKIADVLGSSTRKLLLNHDFINLVTREWLSSLSKTAMIERLQKFIPKIKPEYFMKRGTAGIRTPIITPDGKFLPDVMEVEGPNSFHIINYNSPGATGAPAYSAFVIRYLMEKGYLDYIKKRKEVDSIWKFEEIV